MKKESKTSSISIYSDLPETGYLRIQQVLRFIPVSPATWWRRVGSGSYPQPVKLGPKITAWRAEDIKSLVIKLNQKKKAHPNI